MAERGERRERAIPTYAADAHMADKKARTGRWFRHGFAGITTSVVSLALAFGTILIPPVGLAFAALSGCAALYGAAYTAAAVGSGIVNTLSRK